MVVVDVDVVALCRLVALVAALVIVDDRSHSHSCPEPPPTTHAEKPVSDSGFRPLSSS